MKTYYVRKGLFGWQAVNILSAKEIRRKEKALEKRKKSLLENLGYKKNQI